MKARLITRTPRREANPLPAGVLSPGVRARLPHQERAFIYACSQKHPALFMEMRLGKSKVTIDWVRSLKVRRVLIVAPKTVMYSWGRELELEGAKRVFYVDRSTDFSKVGWYLVNYEMVARLDLGRVAWDVVVADESTRLKNPQAKITKYMISSFKGVPHRAILSGLPRPEGDLDVVSQFLFLRGSFMGLDNYWRFRMAKCYADGYDWVLRPSVVPHFRKALHEGTFFLTKREVGLQMPTTYSVRTVRPSEAQNRFFKQMAGEWAATLPDGTELQTKWVTVKEVWNAQASGGFLNGQCLSDAKVKEVVSLTKGELKGEPVLVWFRFLDELRATEQALLKAGVSCRTLYGATKQADRGKNIQDFQNGGYDVLLIQQRTGLFGLDLSRASTAIYYSTEYSLEARRQSEERLAHPTKKDPLLYIDLVTEHSLDEVIQEALREKWTDARIVCGRYVEKLKEWYGR